MSEPTRLGEGDVLPTGLWKQVMDRLQAQPWYKLRHSDIEAERELGEAMFQDWRRQVEATAAAAMSAQLLETREKEIAANTEALGIGAALADRINKLRTGKEPEAIVKARNWWTRGKAPVLLVLGDESLSLLAAGFLVTRGAGRLVHANELQRKRFDDSFMQMLLDRRVVAITNLFVGGDEKVFFENTLHELLEIRGAAGKRTVLTSALDKTGLLGAVSDGVRRRITGDDAAWLTTGAAR